MSTAAQSRPVAAPGTRCLLLQLEPTPYILPRALYVYKDPELHTDLIWTFVNSSQDWGKDAEIGSMPVLLDRNVSRLAQLGRVAKLMFDILRGRYTVAHLAGWGHWVVRLAILCCKVRAVPFSVESDTPLRGKLTGWREQIKRLVYPIILNWPKLVIPGGSRQAQLFRHYGVSEEKIRISHMTTDTDKIRGLVTATRSEVRATVGLGEGAVVAIFVGRLVANKGISILLEAFKSATARVGNLRLVVIGDGPLRAEVERASRESAGKIVYAGRMEQTQTIGWMRAADMLVLPSTYEPWGLVVNEAMTCGLPVIVSDACGCVDDLVRDGRNGIVVPAGDTKALGEAMMTVASNEKLRSTMRADAESTIAPWKIERQAEVIRAALVEMSQAK